MLGFFREQWCLIKQMRREKSSLYTSLRVNVICYLIVGTMNVCAGKWYVAVGFLFFYIALFLFNINTYKESLERRRFIEELFNKTNRFTVGVNVEDE